MPSPVNKASAFAKALGVDPVFMLMRVLETCSPELREVLKEIMGEKMVTESEFELLKLMRQEVGGVGLSIKSHPEFVETLRAALKTVADREKALLTGAINAIQRNYKPGPRKAVA
jgi:hypothetical protein